MSLEPLRRVIVLAAIVAWLAPATALAADVTVRQLVERLHRADRASPIDISHLDLRDLDMSGLDFKAAKLAGSDLFGADLTGADLSKADLSAARLDRVAWRLDATARGSGCA